MARQGQLPEETNPELLKKVAELNRLRAETWGRIAIGSPGLAVDINRGMSVADAVQRHFPQPEAPDQAEFIRLKAEIIKDYDTLLDSESKRTSISDPYSWQKFILETSVKIFKIESKGYEVANKVAKEALGKAIGQSLDANMDTYIAEVGASEPGSITGLKRLVEKFSPVLVEPGVKGLGSEPFLELMNEYSVASNKKRVVLMEVLDKGVRDRGSPVSAKALLFNAKEAGDRNANEILRLYEEAEQAVDSAFLRLTTEKKELVELGVTGALAPGGVLGTGALADIYDVLWKKHSKNEPISEGIDGGYEIATGKSAPAEKMEDLLRSLEADGLPPSLAAARKMLIESEQFQHYMQKRGLDPLAPGFAIRSLREELRDTQAKARMRNARVEADRQREVEPPSDSARLIGGAAGTEHPILNSENILKNSSRYLVSVGLIDDEIEILAKDLVTGQVKSIARPWNHEFRTLVEKDDFENFGILEQELKESGPDEPKQQEPDVMPPRGGKVRIPSIPEIKAATGNLLRTWARGGLPGEIIKGMGKAGAAVGTAVGKAQEKAQVKKVERKEDRAEKKADVARHKLVFEADWAQPTPSAETSKKKKRLEERGKKTSLRLTKAQEKKQALHEQLLSL